VQWSEFNNSDDWRLTVMVVMVVPVVVAVVAVLIDLVVVSDTEDT